MNLQMDFAEELRRRRNKDTADVEINYNALYRAVKPFQYDERVGQLDADQVVRKLTQHPSNAALVRLRYLDVVPKGTSIVRCKHCGAEFATDSGLMFHGKKRHEKKNAPVFLDPPQPGPARSSDELQFRADRINRELRHSELAGPVDEQIDSEEAQFLNQPDRQIRLDRTKASIQAGVGTIEVKTEKRAGGRGGKRRRAKAKAKPTPTPQA